MSKITRVIEIGLIKESDIPQWERRAEEHIAGSDMSLSDALDEILGIMIKEHEEAQAKSVVEPPIDKKELNLLKLHLSSLFARKQRCVWVHPDNPLTFYYSTLAPTMKVTKDIVSLFTYKTCIDDFIHKVDFKDSTIPDLLYKVIPRAKDNPTCIHLTGLLGVLNKGLYGDMVNNDYECHIVKFNKQKGEDEKVPIADTVSDIMFERVLGWFRAIAKRPISDTIDIKDHEYNKTDVSILSYSIADDINGELDISVPVASGSSVVGIHEYGKKSKKEFTHGLNILRDNLTFCPLYIFDNEYLTCTSVQPNMMIFTI